MDTAKLFEHPIVRSRQINLADQIHDILCEEIHAGRWKVGEKLPSMTTIAEQCQVSRMPVQLAIEQLGAEGYVQQKDRSGVFLESTMPKGQPLGVIGVVLHSAPQNSREMEHLAFEQLLVHRLMKVAGERNYQTHVVYAKEDQDWDEINRVGAVFDENVKGIISLVPFVRKGTGQLEEDRIPLVFWCVPDHRCAPCVASDYEMAFYLLTRRLIEQGHKSIAPVASTIYSFGQNRSFFRGYRMAMQESGLDVREDMFEQSIELGIRDIVGSQKLVKAHSDVTAYACISAERGEQMIQTLASLKIRVPDEVSIACSPPSQEATLGMKVSGVGFSPQNEIEMCFDLLRQQNIMREWRIGTALLTPLLVEGQTVAPLG